MDITLLQHSKDNQPGRTTVDEAARLIRGEGRPEGYQPLLVFAAVLDGGRQKKHVRWLTGLGVAHITQIGADGLAQARQAAADDLHTMLCFADDERQGLYVVYQIELLDSFSIDRQMKFHTKATLWAGRFYASLLKGEADRTVAGVTRPVPMCRDPEAYYNPSVLEFTSAEIRDKPPEDRTGGQSKDTATPREIRDFLSAEVVLRHNVVTGRVEYRRLGTQGWQPLDDWALNTLWGKLRDLKAVRYDDMARVVKSDYAPPFHPFRHYLDSLPPWNGRDDHILALSVSVSVKGGAESQMLFAEYLRKWLVGMVAGWVDESVVNTAMLVLIGPQGKYKTTWFRELMPPELAQYFSTKVNASRMDKDDRLKLSQYGLICFEELDTMRDADMNQLKSVMTMTSTDDRAPYDRFAQKRLKVASFCGTGNNVIFLNDPTGTRRFLPFEVERIDSPYDHPVDHQAVYAQAYALYRQGYRYYFSAEEERVLQEHNRQFETPRPEEELIGYYFARPTASDPGEFMPTTVAQRILSTPGMQLKAVALGRAFAKLGFKPDMKGHRRGYYVVRRKVDEIDSEMRLLAREALSEEQITDGTDVF